MITKFVFQLPGANVITNTGTPGGFDITNIGGGGNNGVPLEIQLRNVTKCSIDAYSFYIYGSSYAPFRDGVVNPNTSADWGCNSGYSNNYNFGKIFGGETIRVGFGSLSTVIDGYTATPSHNYTLGKNYCAISLNLKTGKSCDDVKFGDGYNYFQDSTGNKINSANTLSVGVKCGTNTIDYTVYNSTVMFNQTDTTNPKIEFLVRNASDLGCQYQSDNINYMSFFCNATGGVDAVQYKCGL